MASLTLTFKAKNDLKELAHYTQRRWGREQRNLYLAQLDRTFRRLAAAPGLGAACGYIKPGYRKFTQGSHVIYYREGPGTGVEIIRVLHRHMDVEAGLN